MEERLNPELLSVMDHFYELSEFSDVLIIDQQTVIAEYMMSLPQAGKHIEALISVYLKPATTLNLMFGGTDGFNVEGIAYMVLDALPDLVLSIMIFDQLNKKWLYVKGSNSTV